MHASRNSIRWSKVRNRPQVYLCVLALASLLCCTSIVSQEITKSDIDYLIDRVFANPVSDPKESCAYTVRTTSGDGYETRERYDPYFDDEQAWSLVSVNGAAPTAEQLDGYAPGKRSRHAAVLSFDFIDNASIEFVEQTSDELKLSFDLSGTHQFENEDSIENTMLVDPISAQVNEIRRKSTETFRVGKFAKVFEFETIDKFEFEEETESVVLAMNSVRLRARTGELNVDQFVQRVFSEFDCSTVPVEVPASLREEPQKESDPLFIDPPPPVLDP